VGVRRSVKKQYISVKICILASNPLFHMNASDEAGGIKPPSASRTC